MDATINEEIVKILNPSKKISIIMNDRLSNFVPIMPISLLYEILKDAPTEFQEKILSKLNGPEVVLFGGNIYVKKASVDIKDRIARILISYKENIENMLGEKQALIEIYSKLKPHQIVHLIQHNIVFVMRKLYNREEKNQKMGVVAIKYVPEYEVHFRNDVWRFPGLMLGSYIDANLKFEMPEVIYEGGNYTHMFVFLDKGFVGQRICMGSFYNDTKSNEAIRKRSFETGLSFIMTQAEQILKYGYDEHKNLHPVSEIYEQRFNRFRVR